MQKGFAKFFGGVMCSFIILSAVVVADAQFRAGLQGTVTDSGGGLVSGATVTLTSNETQRSQMVMTSEDGFYRFSSLAPGSYTLTVEQANFKKQVFEDVTVSAENVQGLDVSLSAGGISETVTVTDDTPALETEDANIRKTISNEEILRLPQNGRDPYELARLAPGVFGAGARGAGGGSSNLPNTSGPGGSNLGIFATENQVQISANGQRLSSNNFQIDGTSVNSQTWGGAAVITPSQESVKEVSVTSSTYSAEDGRNSGAQVKVVTQNGTNSFHGSLFFKYNDPGWNAFNQGFDIAGTNRGVDPQRVEVRDKTFGGSVGGRIVRDKLFFFFSYEGLRNRNNTISQGFVETAQLRQLIRNVRPNSIATRILNSEGIEPRVVSVLQRSCADFNFPVECRNVAGGFDLGSPARAQGQYVRFDTPLGGGFDGIADLQYALIENPSNFQGNQYFTRVDYNITSKDNFAFSLFVTPVTQLTSDGAGQSRPGNDIIGKRLNYNTAFIYTRNISATTLNEARFNITRWGFNEEDSNQNVNFGIPRIEIEGFLPGGDRLRFGAPRGENTPGIINERQLDFRDTVTTIFGNQAFKFGGVYRLDLNDNTGNGGARPLFSFVRPWNFANDTPIFEAINADAFGTPQANGIPFSTSELAFFVQDDWKVRPNLTLNLGLRWSYYSPIKGRGTDLSNLVLGSSGLANARIVTNNQVTEPDRNNFGPQIGFAYSPAYFSLNNRLVIRGGFGIGFDRLPNALLANTRFNPPNGARYGLCCGTDNEFGAPYLGGQILYTLGSSNSATSYPRNPILGSGINPATGGPNVGQVEIYGADPNLKTSEVYRYSLEAQYELPYRLTATVGYQGSNSRNFVRIEPLHLTQPSTNSTFNPVYYGIGDVRGNYNSLITRLQRRFGNGFQFDINYKYSKGLDNYSYEAPCGCTNQTFPVDQGEEYGPSDFDVRNFTTVSGLWDIPFFKNRTSTLAKILGGFQLSGILTHHTGFPWTAKVSQGLRGPNGNFFGPIRPLAYNGQAPLSNSNDSFLQAGGLFPNSVILNAQGTGTVDCNVAPGCNRYFTTFRNGDTFQANPPGIGRNTFRGPKYTSLDMSVSKRFGLPSLGVLGESPNLDIRFNFFNITNKLNLANFESGSSQTFVNNPNFGEATGALAGRVVEFQVRFSF